MLEEQGGDLGPIALEPLRTLPVFGDYRIRSSLGRYGKSPGQKVSASGVKRKESVLDRLWECTRVEQAHCMSSTRPEVVRARTHM